MAYPYYQPMNYQPTYYGGNPYYQQAPAQQTQQQPQIQNGGFVSVRSMDEVRNWAIAPGNSITFYVESTPPVIVTKTKGFSQLEMPVIKVFDLTERNMTAQNSLTSKDKRSEAKDTDYALKSDIEQIWSVIDDIKSKLKGEKVKEDGDE